MIVPAVFVALLLAVFIVARPIPVVFFEGRGIFQALSHHFFHANLFHLIVNSYAIFVLYGRKFSAWEFLVSFIIASVSFFFATRPAIGYSNILYATMGVRTPALRSAWWRSPNTVVFLVVTLAYLFFPSVSATTHIAAFAGGVAYAVMRRFSNSNSNDYDKARGSGR